MQVFEIAPMGMKQMWWLVPGVILVIGLLALLILSLRTTEIEVSTKGIQIRGSIYGRFIPAEVIRAEEAKRIVFESSPSLQPKWRTFGTGLPGFQAGWFRLKNGEKALLFLTERSNAVYVPTKEGYSLLFSPKSPDGFLSALKESAGEPRLD